MLCLCVSFESQTEGLSFPKTALDGMSFEVLTQFLNVN